LTIHKPRELSPSFKVWLRRDRFDVIGAGGASLLEAIEKYGSITAAAKKVGVSYKYAWDRLAEIEKALGQPLLRTRRGGRTGGGGAELTDHAIALLKDYDRTVRYVDRVLKDREYWEAIGLRISARNCLQGIVEEVEKGSVVSKVKIRIQAPTVITAVITKEAVEELGVKSGRQGCGSDKGNRSHDSKRLTSALASFDLNTRWADICQNIELNSRLERIRSRSIDRMMLLEVTPEC